jgi:cell division protein FtsN
MPGWVWGLVGLSVGLGVAAWVYLGGHHRAPAPATLAPAAPPAPVAEATKKGPESAPQKPAPVPPAPKPRFEFYTMLPEMEVPTHEPATGKAAETPSVKASGETYILQVATFRSYEEADRLKASLSLLGLEASIQSVTVEGKPLHRVRVGPYTDMAKVNDARRRLKEHALDPILVKGRT